MLTLVTAASSSYFNFLTQLLLNLLKIKNDDINIIVYDLGMNENELNHLKMLTNIIVESFDFNQYPEHVDLKKYYGIDCTYAWKPIIIYKVCEKYGGFVHWMDTRNLYKNFKQLIEILKTEHIYSPTSSGTIKRWTHPTTLKYMDGYKYQHLSPRNGAVFAVDYDIDWVKQFVKEWYNLALIDTCICPDGSDRLNHRQDQSVLSILYYKYRDMYKFKMINQYIGLTIHNKLLSI
tara:strand:+ start:66924 stop:67625 length:702 start_codon:yes stop_codon:yes gene_type:complete